MTLIFKTQFCRLICWFTIPYFKNILETFFTRNLYNTTIKYLRELRKNDELKTISVDISMHEMVNMCRSIWHIKRCKIWYFYLYYFYVFNSFPFIFYNYNFYRIIFHFYCMIFFCIVYISFLLYNFTFILNIFIRMVKCLFVCFICMVSQRLFITWRNTSPNTI